jgi:hypothetical protein
MLRQQHGTTKVIGECLHGAGMCHDHGRWMVREVLCQLIGLCVDRRHEDVDHARHADDCVDVGPFCGTPAFEQSFEALVGLFLRTASSIRSCSCFGSAAR